MLDALVKLFEHLGPVMIEPHDEHPKKPDSVALDMSDVPQDVPHGMMVLPGLPQRLLVERLDADQR